MDNYVGSKVNLEVVGIRNDKYLNLKCDNLESLKVDQLKTQKLQVDSKNLRKLELFTAKKIPPSMSLNCPNIAGVRVN